MKKIIINTVFCILSLAIVFNSVYYISICFPPYSLDFKHVIFETPELRMGDTAGIMFRICLALLIFAGVSAALFGIMKIFIKKNFMQKFLIVEMSISTAVFAVSLYRLNALMFGNNMAFGIAVTWFSAAAAAFLFYSVIMSIYYFSSYKFLSLWPGVIVAVAIAQSIMLYGWVALNAVIILMGTVLIVLRAVFSEKRILVLEK